MAVVTGPLQLPGARPPTPVGYTQANYGTWSRPTVPVLPPQDAPLPPPRPASLGQNVSLPPSRPRPATSAAADLLAARSARPAAVPPPSSSFTLYRPQASGVARSPGQQPVYTTLQAPWLAQLFGGGQG
jgi:hypothetical protein